MFFDKVDFTSDLGAISKGLFTSSKRLKIADLTARQTEVDGGTLNLKLKSCKYHTMPYVVLFNGANILIDGHHTVIAKKLKNQTFVKCKIYTL